MYGPVTARDSPVLPPAGDCVSWSSGVTSGDPTDPALQADSLLLLLEQSGHQPADQHHPDLLTAADQVSPPSPSL